MRPHNASVSHAIGTMTTRIALVGSPRLRVSHAGKGGRSLQVTARGAGADWRWYTRHYRFQGKQQSEPVQLECWLARRAAAGTHVAKCQCHYNAQCSVPVQRLVLSATTMLVRAARAARRAERTGRCADMASEVWKRLRKRMSQEQQSKHNQSQSSRRQCTRGNRIKMFVASLARVRSS